MTGGWLARVPALPAAAGMVAGILLYPQCPQWWAAVAVAAAGIVLLVFARMHTGVAMTCAAIGMLAASSAQPPEVPADWCDGHTYSFSVLCTRSGEGRAEVRIDSVLTATSMSVTPPIGAVAWHADGGATFTEGFRYRLEGSIRPLRTIADVPYARIPSASAIARGASAEIKLEEAPRLLDSPQTTAPRLRQRLCKALIEAGADDRAYEMFCAILLAERDLLRGDTRERYAAAGVAHILALSGFHIGFIACVAALLLFPLNLFPRLRWLKQAGIVALVWTFVWLIGFGAPAMRAAVMATVLYLGRATGRTVSSWNSLCIAIALILAAAPSQLMSAGFQLSVVAVASMLAYVPLLNPVDPRRRVLHRSVQALAVPTAAMGGTMAVTAVWFHALPACFLVSNIAVTLAFPVLMLSGLLMMLCGLAGICLPPLYICANGLCHLLDAFTTHVAAWPGATRTLFVEPAAAIAILVFLGAAAAFLHRGSCRALMLTGVTACVTIIMVPACTRTMPRQEAYVVAESGNTSIVMSCGDRVLAFVTASERYAQGAHRRLRHTLADYAAWRGADSVAILTGDFDFGPFSRMSDIFRTGALTVAIPTGKSPPPSLGHVTHMLLTNRCSAPPAEVMEHLHPDTLVISSDVSLSRRRMYEAESARRRIPSVCLDTVAWQLR